MQFLKFTIQGLKLSAQYVLLAVQGWGQLANLGVLMVGLLAFNSKQLIYS